MPRERSEKAKLVTHHQMFKQLASDAPPITPDLLEKSNAAISVYRHFAALERLAERAENAD